MGYESYNLRGIILDNVNNSSIVEVLQNMGYIILNQKVKEVVLEKSSNNGFIEIQIIESEVSIRTAKANNAPIIFEMIEDIRRINELIRINVFDYQTKQELALDCVDSTLEEFVILQKDFFEHFPSVKSPIRCNDVFKV